MNNFLQDSQYSAWDLFRRGQLDQEKHIKLIKEAIRKNLSDLITHGKIIAGDKVSVPVKHLQQYRFEYDDDSEEGIAAIPDEKLQPGDVIGRKPQQGSGDKGDPGDGGDGDEGYLEVIVNTESVAEILFEDLELPRLKRKQPVDSFKEEYVMENIRKKGIMSNLDKKRTVIQNIKRNASKGNPVFENLADDDLRFKSDNVKKIPQDKVVVFFIRDRSGSMGEQEKHLTRVLSFWITMFLNYKYKNTVEKVHILFDTTAHETGEDEFLQMSEGGGTKISSGVKLTQEIINKRYSPNSYNIYSFLFTDGDNLPSDNQTTINIIKNLLPIHNLFGCADIEPNPYYTSSSSLISLLKKEKEENLMTVNIKNQEDVLTAMKTFFKKTGGERG